MKQRTNWWINCQKLLRTKQQQTCCVWSTVSPWKLSPRCWTSESTISTVEPPIGLNAYSFDHSGCLWCGFRPDEEKFPFPQSHWAVSARDGVQCQGPTFYGETSLRDLKTVLMGIGRWCWRVAFPVKSEELVLHQRGEGSLSSAAQDWSSVDPEEKDCHAEWRSPQRYPHPDH